MTRSDGGGSWMGTRARLNVRSTASDLASHASRRRFCNGYSFLGRVACSQAIRILQALSAMGVSPVCRWSVHCP